MTTHLMEILDHAALIRSKSPRIVPAAGEEESAQELMILLHTGPFLIKRGEISPADELRDFAGHHLDRTQNTQQKQRK